MIDKKLLCTELKVLNKIQETSDTISLVLDIPRTTGGKFNYRAGQFITLFLDLNGEDVRRSYSLASSPETDRDFKITIKLVPGGKGSTYLVEKIKPGDTVWATPPAGQFCLPEPPPDTLVLFAAGSGITPIFSLLKSFLKLNPIGQCALIYQNRREDQIIFKAALDELEKNFGERLHVTHVLSTPSPNWAGPKGRISDVEIKKRVTSFSPQNSHFYLCGPDGFMKQVSDSLGMLPIPKAQIHQESFQSSPQAHHIDSPTDDFEIDDDAILIGDASTKAKAQTIEAEVDGEVHSVPYRSAKDSILDALLKANLNPPYSCLDGACMACIAKVEEGLVYQKDLGILTDDNVEAKECLTCQARPASSRVKIKYESF